MTRAYCKTCDKHFDLNEIHFVDQDFLPMVLSCQIKGRATKKRAMQYLEEIHPAYDDRDIEPDTPFEYSAGVPRLSHEEPGDEDHGLVGIPKGYWSFDV